MNFLVTGGAGSVGQDLTASLLKKGHRIRVLDKNAEAFGPVSDGNLTLLSGRLEDPHLVRRALEGVDVVVHLAWSFSDDPVELLEGDLKGHVALLEACVAARVSRFFYTSTAVVYGKPLHLPVLEDASRFEESARKPFYAIAKVTAEKLALAYGVTKGLPVTIFRFWWSYGAKIGGRHLREMSGRGSLLVPPAIATADCAGDCGVPSGPGENGRGRAARAGVPFPVRSEVVDLHLERELVRGESDLRASTRCHQTLMLKLFVNFGYG